MWHEGAIKLCRPQTPGGLESEKLASFASGMANSRVQEPPRVILPDPFLLAVAGRALRHLWFVRSLRTTFQLHRMVQE